MDLNAFPIFVDLLGNGLPELKRESCWALVNAMMPQKPQQLEHLVEVKTVDYLVEYMLKNPTGLPLSLYSAVVRGLRNLASADKKYAALLREKLTDEVLAIFMSTVDPGVYQTLYNALYPPENTM
jgi:hypothetical protein